MLLGMGGMGNVSAYRRIGVGPRPIVLVLVVDVLVLDRSIFEHRWAKVGLLVRRKGEDDEDDDEDDHEHEAANMTAAFRGYLSKIGSSTRTITSTTEERGIPLSLSQSSGGPLLSFH